MEKGRAWRRALGALLVCVAGTGVLAAEAPAAKAAEAPAVEAALQQLSGYTYASERRPLALLELTVTQALHDPVRQEHLAARFAAVFGDAAATKAARLFAAGQLQLVGGDAEVPVLAAALAGEPEIADAARRALEAIPTASALAALRDAVPRLEGEVLAGAVNSLGRRRDPGAVSGLEHLLSHPDPTVAAGALWSLGRIGTEDAARALGEAKVPASLVAVFTEARLEAAARLAAAGRAAVAADVYLAVWRDVPGLRRTSLAALVSLRDARALPLLFDALDDDDAVLRATALQLAVAMPGKAVTTRLLKQLEAAKPEDRIPLLEALGQRGDRTAAPSMVRSLAAEDEDLRRAAVTALGQLGDGRHVEALAALASAELGPVRDAARKALTTLSGPGVDEALLKGIRGSDNNAQRIECIRAAEKRRTTAAAPDLLQALQRGDAAVKGAAADALAVVGGPAEYAPLIGLVASVADARAQARVIRCIQAVGRRLPDGISPVSPLLTALHTAPAEAVAPLLELLASFGGEDALAAVRQRLQGDPAARDQAVRALAKWPDAAAAPDLLKLSREAAEPVHRQLALRGYLQLIAGMPDADARLRALEDVRQGLRTQENKRLLLASLATVADPGALRVVVAFLEDDTVRLEAVAAALQIGRALLDAQPTAVVESMDRVVATATDRRMKQDAEALRRQAQQAVAPQRREQALQHLPDRSAARQRELAADLPAGAALVAYLDCGADARASGSGGLKVGVTRGVPYFWVGAELADRVRYGSIVYDATQVVCRVSGLAPGKALQIGLSWWDFDHATRAQSVWVKGAKQAKPLQLLERTVLPSYARGKQSPMELRLPVPPEVCADGSLEVIIRNEGTPNVVLSELWLIQAAQADALPSAIRPGRAAAAEPRMPALPLPSRKDAKAVLIVTGQDYPGHKWQETAPVLAEELGRDKRLEILMATDPRVLRLNGLEAYAGLVLHFMDWQQPDPGPQARANLERFVRNGGGLIVVHFACGAFQDWDGFVRLVGRVWDPKLRGHDPFGGFHVIMTDVKHPITAGLTPFETVDELYTCLAGDTPITVLAQARSKVDKRLYPMAFVLQVGKGRVFQSPLGHNAAAYRTPGTAELLRRGTAWAAGLPPLPPAQAGGEQ